MARKATVASTMPLSQRYMMFDRSESQKRRPRAPLPSGSGAHMAAPHNYTGPPIDVGKWNLSSVFSVFATADGLVKDSFLDEDGRTDWFTVAYNVATVAPCIPEWSSFKDEKDYDALSEVIAHLWKQSQDEDEDGDERDDDEDIPAHLPQPSEWSGGVLQLSEEQVDFGKSRSFWSALKSVSTSKRAGIYRLYRCVVATLPVGVVPG